MSERFASGSTLVEREQKRTVRRARSLSVRSPHRTDGLESETHLEERTTDLSLFGCGVARRLYNVAGSQALSGVYTFCSVEEPRASVQQVCKIVKGVGGKKENRGFLLRVEPVSFRVNVWLLSRPKETLFPRTRTPPLMCRRSGPKVKKKGNARTTPHPGGPEFHAASAVLNNPRWLSHWSERSCPTLWSEAGQSFSLIVKAGDNFYETK